MISEVVTNAVLHGRGKVTLRLHCGPHVVRVEVCDEARALPALSTPSCQAEGGRGMLIVDTLATTWGVSLTSTGKSVWFEVVTAP